MRDKISTEFLSNNDNEPARLRGKLLTDHKATIPRLRGRLLDRMVEVGKIRDEPAHAPTWSIEFGAHGSTYGELHRDGFEAWNSNHASSQDAFAVSIDRKRFAVADGMGGYGADKEGTRFLAKYIADRSVEGGIDDMFDLDRMATIYREADIAFQAHSGRPFQAPRVTGRGIGTVGTTLSYAEVLDSTHVRIVAIGDSPVFKLDNQLVVVAQYGEDAQSGDSDLPLAHKLGIDSNQRPLIPVRATASEDGRAVVDAVISFQPGEFLAIGTDYFSEDKADQLLPALAAMNASQYHQVVSTRGKRDDATLIVLDPYQLSNSIPS